MEVNNITVHASQVEGGGVDIPGVPYDISLSHSLISSAYAQSTRGTIMRTDAALSLYDSDRNLYRSSSYVTLTWWICGTSVSTREDFYITDDLRGGPHAMLRYAPGDADHRDKALPLFNKVPTAGTLPIWVWTCVLVFSFADTCFTSKEEKRRAEERHEREDNAHNAIRQAENQKIEDKTRKLTASTIKPNSDPP
jgi:hypothetical protein